MIPSDSAFKTAIFKALCACLSLQPSSADALKLIREAYTEPENTPRPARTVDVVYWSVSPSDGIDDPAHYGDISQTGHNQKATVFRANPYSLLVVCYGSHAEANAINIRSFLYVDGYGSPRQILRSAGIFPVPDPEKPDYLFEPEGSLWRRRVDVRFDLQVKDERTYGSARGSVQSGPFVILRH